MRASTGRWPAGECGARTSSRCTWPDRPKRTSPPGRLRAGLRAAAPACWRAPWSLGSPGGRSASHRRGVSSPRRGRASRRTCLPRLDDRFARARVSLAVSLHAVDPAARLALLPVARRFSLGEVRAAIARAPRTVLLQWTLIQGVNDSDREADALADFARGLDVRVNLIPLNPGPDPRQVAPPLARCRAFQRRLAAGGVRTLLRLPHGQSVGGACGQLAGSLRTQAQG